jgi:hypothetical protein
MFTADTLLALFAHDRHSTKPHVRREAYHTGNLDLLREIALAERK